ncbi:hypothetical protein [Leucobacter soli]|uniref:hypothetical protein n=1 Tax=Leucobacter soli TaxID=2812850 RepID=UPI00361EEB4F
MLPLVALALKGVSTGWLMVIILFGPIIGLFLGYALQVVIAVQGFLVRRALFAGSADAKGAAVPGAAAASRRAALAAWTSLTGILLLGVFMPDGGDNYFGSTFQLWLGAYGPNADAVHAATDALNTAVAGIAALLWLGGFVWLAVEWFIGLRRRATRV